MQIEIITNIGSDQGKVISLGGLLTFSNALVSKVYKIHDFIQIPLSYLSWTSVRVLVHLVVKPQMHTGAHLISSMEHKPLSAGPMTNSPLSFPYQRISG